ncbi:MAG: hypothetical protein IPJ27_15845 [Candidatus Accumulibacter sp.]|uniref:Uncharacterized protein n=1 Tax=Candidatus Accumulibacter proximus TaxID=2954385 RepID=A0A935Q200_9PROT|nr:hypothetical protein [Candidatus Accumulibacter proximus]
MRRAGIRFISVNQTPADRRLVVLAAERVRDAGSGRLIGDIEGELRARSKDELEHPAPSGLLGGARTLLTRGMSPQAAIRRRIAAAEALGKIGGNRFWSLPHGEPEWVDIPAGEFTMGEGSEAHRVLLPAYAIARLPVTNAQDVAVAPCQFL